MDQSVISVIRHACRQLLRPIASVVLKCGMTWKEFADLSKSVFVEVASGEFGIRGRPTNVSRVSILTGISRKEVKRQRLLLEAPETGAPTKTTDATRLLSGWHQDPDFLDDRGQPLPLRRSGASPTFSELFDRYGGDTPTQTLEKELRGAESIDIDINGNLVAKSRYHMPFAMTEGNIRFFGMNLFDHATTLNRNITAQDDSERRFEGFAVDDHIDPDSEDAFKEFIDKRGQQFLEEVDDWLNRHRADSSGNSIVPIRLGVGLYAIDGPLPKGK
jgi:Family of unknown function (DUF6502)